MDDQQNGKPTPAHNPSAHAHLPSRLRLVRFARRYRHLLWVVIISAALLVFWSLLPVGFRGFLLRGLRSHPWLAVSLFGFTLLTLSLLWSGGQAIDSWVFLHFNTRRKPAPWLDWVMLGFTQLGSGTLAFLLAGLFYFQGQELLAYRLVLGTLTLWLMVELIKAAVRRPRPFAALVQARIVGARMPGRSFPSGHTSQAFFLATLLVQALQPALVWVVLLYLAAILVGITRMYVGAHYPRDVVAGAILGSMWVVLGVIIEGRFLP